MRPILIAACCLMLAPSTAIAADPGIWVVTGTPTVPSRYRQGMASDPARNVFFAGPQSGIYRTKDGKQTASKFDAIAPDVRQREQYNHIGDIAWDAAENGRLLLPLESFRFGEPDPNPSHTGSLGVLDPATLGWRYYVKLDPAEIEKAMWVATTPDGLAWTSSGDDLLAYNLADISLANAAPGAAPIHSVKRLAGVVPPGGIAGAVYFNGLLFISGGTGSTRTIRSIDLQTGAGRLEYERATTQESEGLDVGAYSGGILHWELANSIEGFKGSFIHLLVRGTLLELTITPGKLHAGRRTTLRARVTARVGADHIPLAGVRVKLGKSSAKTDAAGRAKLRVTLTRGSYRATGFFKGLRTATRKLRAI